MTGLDDPITDPHLDLLVDRMRIGFGPFGLRDIDRAVEAGGYTIIGDDRALAWSQLNWLMAAGGRDILGGELDPDDERPIVEGMLRVMGVAHHAAHAATRTELPPAPDLAIDFAYALAS